MKSLLLALLLLALAQLVMRRHSGTRQPAAPPTPDMRDCVEECFDAPWLSHLEHPRPNRGRKHG